jgi:hypothetical protein
MYRPNEKEKKSVVVDVLIARVGSAQYAYFISFSSFDYL